MGAILVVFGLLLMFRGAKCEWNQNDNRNNALKTALSGGGSLRGRAVSAIPAVLWSLTVYERQKRFVRISKANQPTKTVTNTVTSHMPARGEIAKPWPIEPCMEPQIRCSDR
jgi:hypothetical protein